jgi:glutamate-5-semialdehyde dehydrogenase
MSDLKEMILEYGRRARVAARQLARTSTAQRTAGVCAMAEALLEAEQAILAANVADLDQARTRGLSGAMLERCE